MCPALIISGAVTACGGAAGPDSNQTGQLVVSLVTTGADLDPDGYDLLLNATRLGHFTPDDRRILSALPTGDYVLYLEGVAPNCATPADGLPVRIDPADPVRVEVEVRCRLMAPAFLFVTPFSITRLQSPGARVQLQADVRDSAFDIIPGLDREIGFLVQDTSIATVDTRGTVLLTGARGTTTVTASYSGRGTRLRRRTPISIDPRIVRFTTNPEPLLVGVDDSLDFSIIPWDILGDTVADIEVALQYPLPLGLTGRRLTELRQRLIAADTPGNAILTLVTKYFIQGVQVTVFPAP